jgi:penicillin amidase
VSAERSSSGRPLLASDPHLALGLPSIWYQIHLSGGGLDVAGGSIPGTPFVTIGQNQRIAWGITALFADVQDLYLETVDPSRPGQYLHQEEWHSFDVVPLSIPVKDQPSVTEEIRLTRHGVVIGTASDGRPVSQKWDALFSGDHVQALLDLNRAASWEEFTLALANWSAPSLAFVYADAQGNVGFFPAGQIPVRVGFDGAMPLDGASGENEWDGAIPHSLKPMIFNPEDGLVVSANHRMLPPETPYPLGSDTLADFRARRIRELLLAARTLSLDDFERIQNDRYDASTEAILRYAVALNPEDDGERAAVERLRDWSGQMSEGPGPAIYHALYRRLVENTFGDELGEELFGEYLSFLQIGHSGGLHAVVDDEASMFWDDRSTPNVESRRDIFQKSLAEGVAMLTERFGPDVSSWDWKTVHEVSLSHPLGRVSPLDLVFNRDPAPFGGSTFTIANAVVSLEAPFETTIGTSFRFLADLANLSASRSSLPSGASGHPLSPHYYDQNEDWLSGRSRPLLVDRNSIEADALGHLILQP